MGAEGATASPSSFQNGVCRIIELYFKVLPLHQKIVTTPLDLPLVLDEMRS